MTLQSKCEDACCVGWARGMDAISLPAPHLILLFVEKSSLCPARPLPQPSTACCCFIIEKSCCDRLRAPWCGKMECIYLSTLGLVIPGQFSFGNRQNKTTRASRIGHLCAWINRRFFFFFCCIILSVLGRIWRGMKMKMLFTVVYKCKKKVVLQLFST